MRDLIAMKVGFVVKDLEESHKLAREIDAYLSNRGIETYFDELSAKKIGVPEKELNIREMKTDLIIAMGGDGTILKPISLIPDKSVPIFGINFGSMGFLTACSPDRWEDAVYRIISDDYRVEERIMLNVEIDGKSAGDALNEAVVMTAVPVKMLHFEVRIDGQVIDSIRADGVMISTPTGSTAYSMSAGGPIVDPRVKGFIITAISPFKYGARSFVVPHDAVIQVKILQLKKGGIIVIDGEVRGDITSESKIVFKLSDNRARFIRLKEDFYKRIRERL